MNEYYNPSNAPATGSTLSSATIRAEFSAIGTAMDKMPVMAGNGDEVVTVNPGASGLTSKTSLAVVGEATTLATSKATPVDADTLPITDSAAANGLKKLSWANLKAAVKAYYDPLTATLTNKTINLANNTLSGTLAQFSAAVSDADLVSLSGIETLTNKTLTSPILSNPAITGSISGTTDVGEVSLSTISQSLHSGSIVKAIVYDTTKDSDGGAWRKRTAHTSWYQEALGFTGKWLGQKTSTAAAWATSGAAAGDGFQNSTDGKYYVLTGTSTASEIFRGNVREFPAVVAVVAETARVVIYDLTQPTCPMWMVFAGSDNGYMVQAGTKTSMAAANGAIAVGTSANLNVVLFASDSADAFNVTARFRYSGNVAGRNVSTGYRSVAVTPIVNSAVNDVAITVLDTAPIDAATGLPVPTIAVATAGGTSVIRDNGSIWDVTGVLSGAETDDTFVAFDRAGRLWIGDRGVSGSSVNVAGFKALPSADVAISTADYRYSTMPYYYAGGKVQILGAQKAATGDDFAGALGLSRLKHGLTHDSGMVDYITNTYNSGWMVGDIRGAWLADTTAETISGSGELIANGDFSSSTGWTLPTGWSIAAGKLTYGGTGAANSNAAYTVATVAGRSYVATITLDSISAGSVLLRAYGASNVDHLVSAAGQMQVTFVASASTTAIAIQNQTAGQTLQLDNISVKLAEPDRCVKNRGLIVNGSLTKSAVASGAGLVAYSGFSASTNYLSQPYNSDLDFGTGDFCYMGWFNFSVVTGTFSLFDRGGSGSGRVALAVSASNWWASVSATSGAAASLGVAATAGLHFVVFYRESGVLKLSVDGVQIYSVANTASVTNTTAPLVVGVAYDLTVPLSGSAALFRVSATAPSADQIAHIYRTELPLFQAIAQCTLAGSSAAVTTLAYDEDTTLLHVGTSWGRSSFKDLTRIDSEATSTGALTSLSASGGVIVTGGTSGKVYMPALLLRDELRRKAEARKALGKLPVFFDYTATASQTAFVVPKGYTVKALYKNGTLMREATTGVYWTRSNDGFSETATLSVGASASDWISIMAVRS